MRHLRHPSRHELSAAAASFEFAVIWLAAAAVVLTAGAGHVTGADWVAFAALAPLTAAVHLLGADREKHQGSHLSLAPMFLAVLILPPPLAAGLIAAAFVPEWIRSRVRWYIVLFNVANFVGPALAARAAFDAVAGGTEADWALGALAAVGVFVALQYVVLAGMLRLARGVRIRETARGDCLVIDAGLVSLGAVAAALWELQPGLVTLALLPLGLAYRSLAIPRLVEATRIEPKTGLYNLRHFHAALAQELGRAARFDRPLAVLMVDIDHLRDVNSDQGHLAGDRALRSVARALEESTRAYDVVARFGGDEFCILLPETELDGALAVAERIRADVEAGPEGITVTIGVASNRGASVVADELLALADRAAYRAKFSGRNTVAVPPPSDAVGDGELILLEAAG